MEGLHEVINPLGEFDPIPLKGIFPNFFDDWLKSVDALVAAVSDWGFGTKYLVYDAVFLNKDDNPTTLIFYDFQIQALTYGSEAAGYPAIPIEERRNKKNIKAFLSENALVPFYLEPQHLTSSSENISTASLL